MTSQWKNQAKTLINQWEKEESWKDKGAWVWVKWKSGSPKDAWKAWEKEDKNHQIRVWSTTGDWDCQIWVKAETPEQAEKLINDVVWKNQWVKEAETTWSYQWS
jgi:hypothetical protein